MVPTWWGETSETNNKKVPTLVVKQVKQTIKRFQRRDDEFLRRKKSKSAGVYIKNLLMSAVFKNIITAQVLPILFAILLNPVTNLIKTKQKI